MFDCRCCCSGSAAKCAAVPVVPAVSAVPAVPAVPIPAVPAAVLAWRVDRARAGRLESIVGSA